MNLSIKTLGCKVNQADSADLAQKCIASGIPLTDEVASASVMILNTCSVTARADAKARKEIRRALQSPHIDRVVVTGCGAVIQGEELARIDERVIVEPDKSRVVPLVASLVAGDSNSTECDTEADLLSRTRVNLKISDGCDRRCSYCIVPYARGSAVSYAPTQIIAQARALVERGANEIVLTGIDLGSYRGRDGTGAPLNLAGLIQRLQDETGIHRIRISSIEPQAVGEDLIALFETTGVLCEHLHIPLQSGSDRVLHDMNRPYTSHDYQSLIERLRKSVPYIAVHTDIIVGYPSESESDFMHTLQLASALGFAGMHLFIYSARPGTSATSLMPLDPHILNDRFARLRDVANASKHAYYEARIASGKPLELVIESRDDRGMRATSREHLTFTWDAGEDPFPHAEVGAIVMYQEGGIHAGADYQPS